ncbi:MAG: hypothetical protein KJ077_19905 [Anaerolineae bacterium]|nr:hypothetical protein [Anaerolineae bacterium]
MAKLIESIGKIIQSIFAPNIIWLVIVGVAVFTWALLLAANSCPGGFGDYFGICSLLNPDFKLGGIEVKSCIGLVVLATSALIVAKVAIWVIKLLKDQLFV